MCGINLFKFRGYPDKGLQDNRVKVIRVGPLCKPLISRQKSIEDSMRHDQQGVLTQGLFVS